jgi:peptidoglycan hydrolase-like protein with peptidoglycan-binding domain
LKPADVKLADVRPAEVRSAEVKPAAAVSAIAKTNAAPAAPASVTRPPAPIPVSSRSDPVGDLIIASRRVAAVQRALTDYGYGQLKPTGTVGSDTLAAIQKFERDRKLPITGQMSDRLVRELSAATGRAID